MDLPKNSTKNAENLPEITRKAYNSSTLLTKTVQTWAFGDLLIRTLQIDNESYFVGKDVAKALEYRAADDMTRYLDDDEKLIRSISVAGQNREMILINEPGLYHAIFMSRKETAKEFRRWVTNEVLPAIRKTGTYTLTLDAELEQEKKRLEIAQFRANRYILEHLEELGEKKLLTRSAIQKVVGNAAGDNSASAFSDEDMRVKNFIFETCKVVEIGFVPAAELYEHYEIWSGGNCLSRNTFVRRVQKIMGKFVDYKQKRVNGELMLVFTGIELQEVK
ncbi:MAG: Bro-N domain-containing protein [Treponema sp.]|nr:Bro-N domain-containing protein [Treponema sp.]